MQALILGLGNTLLADDGAGVHAVRAMRSRLGDDAGLTLLDGGTLSFSLLPQIERAARLVVLDATQMNAAPGTVQCFEGDDLDGLLSRPRRSVHEVSLLDLLNGARLTGRLPQYRALIGVQPEVIDWSDALSTPVRTAIPWMVDIALERIAAWNDEAGDSAKDLLASPADETQPGDSGHALA